jgi:hypothetical protein
MSFDSPYVADTEFFLSQRLSTTQYSTTPYLHLPRATPQQDSQSHNHCPPASARSSPHPTPVLSASFLSTEANLRLTDLLGQGAAGYVFLGTAKDGSQYVVKVAPWREGKEMLKHSSMVICLNCRENVCRRCLVCSAVSILTS